MDKLADVKEIGPEHGTASGHLELGTRHLSHGRFKEARASFEKAIALDSNVSEFWYQLAFTQAGLGLLDLAVDSFEKSIQLGGDNPAPYFELGRVHRLRGDTLAATSTFLEAARHGRTIEETVLLANNFLTMGDAEAAIVAFRHATTLDPKSIAAWEGLGAILQSAGRFEESRAAYHELLNLDPQSAVAHYRLIAIKTIETGDEDLLSSAQAVLASPNISTSHRETLCYALGKGFDDLKDFEKAIGFYDQANRLAFRSKRRSTVYDRTGYERSFAKIAQRFTPQTFQKWKPFASESDVPIFIVGMPRSGTSLVEQILSSHPEVSPGSELGFWLSDPVKRFLVDVPLTEQACSRLATAYLDTLRGLSRGRPRVTDKQPNNFVALGLIHSLFPNAKIIHCRRNPIDNCFSIYTTPYREPPEYAFSRSDIVSAFVLYRDLMDHWRQYLPSSCFLEVDYETLVNDWEKVIPDLLQFCDLKFDASCFAHATNSRIVQTPSFWQVRQPIYFSSVGRSTPYRRWLPEFKTLDPDSPANKSLGGW
jgi:Flp pilus assembly protein TadD